MAGLDAIASAQSDGSSGDGQPWPKPSAAWYAMFLFVAATGMNFFDQAIFGLMISMIKVDFHLTDNQVGLLLGPAGVIFFLFVGIPLSKLVDSYPRNLILGGGLLLTSLFTALGGVAQGYRQFFATRMLTGVGGSAHAPGVYSMMADLFPPHKLQRAIAVLQAGFILGLAGASFFGGQILAFVAPWQPTEIGPLTIRNWQWVLIGVAVPGIILSALIFLLPEPARRVPPDGATNPSFLDVFREIWTRRGVYFPLFIGLALISIETQGILAWRQPFMQRTYGWGPAETGMWGAFVILLSFPPGVILGTWLTERLRRRHGDAPVRATAFFFVCAIPFSIAMPLMPTPELAMLMAACGGLFGGASAVPQNVAIQTITPNMMRGRITAIYLFMYIAFGAAGASVVAFITTIIVADEGRLWLSIVITAASLLPLAALAIVLAVKPYGREIERLEALGRI